MTPEECKSLMSEGTKLEKATLGTEKDKQQYTRINVIFSGYENEQEYEDALRGDSPMKDAVEKKPN